MTGRLLGLKMGNGIQCLSQAMSYRIGILTKLLQPFAQKIKRQINEKKLQDIAVLVAS